MPKGMISAQKVYRILRESGQEALVAKLRATGELSLSRKDVAKIRRDLVSHGLVVLKRKTTNPSDFEFVNPKFVTIAKRRHLEKPHPVKHQD